MEHSALRNQPLPHGITILLTPKSTIPTWDYPIPHFGANYSPAEWMHSGYEEYCKRNHFMFNPIKVE
ncbi:MAG: hypothetical protein Q4G63_05755 [Bacteroidia bacterium]|nr:hypothetical protein [Bacteroidia bacterium]